MPVSKFQFFIFEIAFVIITLVLLGELAVALAETADHTNDYCQAYQQTLHATEGSTNYLEWFDLFTSTSLQQCLGLNGSLIWGVLLAIIGISAVIFIIPVITS